VGRGTWVAALPLLRACNARHARCILDRFTHSLLTSGLPRIARSAVANQCGALAVGTGTANADCRAPRSFEHNSRHTLLHIGSFHALSSHEWLGSHTSLGSSQSVRLNCAKENVSRRGPARSSLRRKARTLHIELDRSTHPLPTSGLSVAPRCCSSSFPLRPRHSLSSKAKARSYLASR